MHPHRYRLLLTSSCFAAAINFSTFGVAAFSQSSEVRDQHPTEKGERELVARLQSGFSADLQRLDAALQARPDSVSLRSRRGDTHLLLGQFAEAIADFERTIALDPAEDAPHWRLGIAYYFAGQWEKSSRQFAKYHAYDGHDRENGIWKFLADAAAHGVEPARKEMLNYAKFDREPFPELYDLLAGKLTAEALTKDLTERGLLKQPEVKFFADYYGGLNEELLGHHEAALAKLHTAVFESPMARGEEAPSYMWQVARVHYAWLLRGGRKSLPVTSPEK
jgi:tetratricopeptide (TPR) repeat protein